MRIVEVYDEESQVLANWDEVPDELYVCTFEEYLDSIAEFGLGVKSKRRGMGSSQVGQEVYSDFYNGDGFFLAVDIGEAISYMSDDQRSNSDLVVLIVPKNALDKKKLYYDLNNESLLDYLNGDSENFTNNMTTYWYAGVLKNPQEVCEIVD